MLTDQIGLSAVTASGACLLRFLSFDSELFNLKCGKLEMLAPSVAQADLRHIMEQIRQDGYRHIVVKIPAEWVQVAHQLEDHGFHFMLSSVCLQKNIEEKRALPTDVTIGSEQDLERLCTIALDAYSSGTRFFLDPIFPLDRVQMLYRRWITEEILNKGADILVHRHHGEITGYATLAREKNLGENGCLGFLAVSKQFSQRGIGNHIVQGLDWCGWPDLKHIHATAEYYNYRALKIYSRNGFFATGLWNVFHWRAD